jgi:beta-N-acetylhexosaminidase
MGTGKHFPGLGASRVDSHSALPTIDRSRDEIMRQDLLPYLELFSKINARLNAIIIGHAHYPAFNGPAALPASLSKNIVNTLLRDELSFRGLSITDDIEMGAVTSTRDVTEAAVMAVEAGNDMVMALGSPERTLAAWQSMVQAARDGRITKAHISRAFDHIARVKSMVSPPQNQSDLTVARLRERIAELNLQLQHTK